MSNFISNSFQLPNDLIDKGYMAKMKGAALPCYLFIVRKTRGWDKSKDHISISQLVEATGYKKDAVIAGVDCLIEMGIVQKITYKNRPSKYTLTDNIIAVGNPDSDISASGKTDTTVGKTESKIDSAVGKTDSSVGKTESNLSEKPTVLSEIPTHNNKRERKRYLSSQHEWIPDEKQLEEKIKFAGRGKEIDLIFGLPSFEFELSSFNSHFKNQVMSDSQKLHKFTSWIIDKLDRYKKSNPEYGVNPSPEQHLPTPAYQPISPTELNSL